MILQEDAHHLDDIVGGCQRERHVTHRATQVDLDTGVQQVGLRTRTSHHHHVDAEGSAVVFEVQSGDDGLLDGIKQTRWDIAR